VDELTSWIASHTPIYYGPALAAWLVVYRFTTDFSFSWVRNLIRGAVFAVLIGSKFVITAEGISPVPLWQHALTGSAGFALVALLFWTIGGFGLCLLLDAILETLKAATKALKNTVITAGLLMLFGAIGAMATAPLGRMLDERFAPPPLDIPPSVVPQVVDAIAPAGATNPAAATAAPAAAPVPTSVPAAAPATALPAAAPATGTAPTPATTAPAATPTTQPIG
jgi:hypothetical protein